MLNNENHPGRRLAALASCAALFVYPAAVYAGTENEQTMFAAAGISSKTLEYEIFNREETRKLTSAVARIGYVMDVTYISFNVEKNIDDDESIGERGIVLSASREDRDVSIGYIAGRGISLFAGMKDGVTGHTGTASADVGGTPDNINGKWYFRERGPFAGIAYQWVVNSGNSITLSLARAVLDFTGELESTDSNGEKLEVFTGDAKGNSYGVSWNRKVNDSTMLNLDYKHTRYNIEYDYSSIYGAVPDTDEIYRSAGFSVISYF